MEESKEPQRGKGGRAQNRNRNRPQTANPPRQNKGPKPLPTKEPGFTGGPDDWFDGKKALIE